MFNNYPYMYQTPRTFNFSNFLNNASKTLNVVNQAIPVIKEVKPILNNARTIFKIVNGLNSTQVDKTNNISNKEKVNNGPSFFI